LSFLSAKTWQVMVLDFFIPPWPSKKDENQWDTWRSPAITTMGDYATNCKTLYAEIRKLVCLVRGTAWRRENKLQLAIITVSIRPGARESQTWLENASSLTPSVIAWHF
jgi:hypothetical protein